MSLSRGLVGHWSLDDESYNPATKRVTDKSAYNNHGTSVNAASFVSDRMGQADRAMDFNGSSDCVDCGSGDSLDITDAITVSAWVKPDIFLGVQRIVTKFGTDGAGYNGYSMILSGDKLLCQIYKNGGGDEQCSSFKLTTDWNHIGFTFYNTDVVMWLNETSESHPGTVATCGICSANLQIGRYIVGSQYFKGSIADVRIYNRILTSPERTLLHESYRPKTIIV